jgi:hypothetical protein
MLCYGVCLEPLARFKTINTGHHYVKHNDVWFCQACPIDASFAISRRDDFKPLGLQTVYDNGDIVGVVVNNQNQWMLWYILFHNSSSWGNGPESLQ